MSQDLRHDALEMEHQNESVVFGMREKDGNAVAVHVDSGNIMAVSFGETRPSLIMVKIYEI